MILIALNTNIQQKINEDPLYICPYSSPLFSYRLELMRQIYNIESPPTRTEDSSPNTTPTGNDGFLAKSLFKCPLASAIEPKLDAVEQKTIGIDVNHGGRPSTTTAQEPQMSGSGELLKCLATCANASRLSLANLLPSRSDTRYRICDRIPINKNMT